jgi:hypothetical protein
MAYLTKYGVARHVYRAVLKAGGTDFAVGADWTPVNPADVQISKDGGATADVTNLPVAIAMAAGAMWDFFLTATELQAAQVIVTVVDAAAKAVVDHAFAIETYGHASAQHAVDLADSIHAGLTSLKNLNVSAVEGLTFTVQSDGGNAVTQVKTDRTEAVNDYWLGAYVRVLTGALAGQIKRVTGYVGATKIITFGAFTGIPANGVLVELINS